MHALHDGALAADVAGRLGARLGGLISLDLPVAPGFVIGTAAWHLSRLLGEAWELPATVAEEVRGALGELDGDLVTVRAAPARPGVAGGPPWATPGERLEAVLESIARQPPARPP